MEKTADATVANLCVVWCFVTSLTLSTACQLLEDSPRILVLDNCLPLYSDKWRTRTCVSCCMPSHACVLLAAWCLLRAAGGREGWCVAAPDSAGLAGSGCIPHQSCTYGCTAAIAQHAATAALAKSTCSANGLTARLAGWPWTHRPRTHARTPP
eukprot:scaffold4103_cov119-Isochrysis_galbana.AAC.1